MLLKCPGWSGFEKVFTENIGSRSLLVFVTGPAPKVGDSVQLQVPAADGAMNNLLGNVVRVEPDATGRTGVAIEIMGGPSKPTEGLIRAKSPFESPVPGGPGMPPPNVGRPGSRVPPAARNIPPPPPPPPIPSLQADPTFDELALDGSSPPGHAEGIELDLEDLSSQQVGQAPPAGAHFKRSPEQSPPPPVPGSGLRRSPTGPGTAQRPLASPPPQPMRPSGQAAQRPSSPEGGRRPSRAPFGSPPTREQSPHEAIKQIGVRPGWGLRQSPAVVGRAEAPVVGIDFGTTYSKVALVHEGEVVLIEDEASKSSSRAAIPSAVAYLANGGCVVGEPARELLATEPQRVITSVKRVMGLTFSDPLANGLLGSLSCPSRAGPNDSIVFLVNGRETTVPEVCARIIEHLKNLASKWAGAPVKKAVFTVPVDFDIRSKRELEIAARMAGVEIAGLVPEPVAAAMGCGHDGSGQSFVAVYDFGGGTFDASIVEVGQNRFTVRGAAGDRWLGGDDFDEVLARYVADEFQKSSGVSLHNRAEEWQRLLFACEEAKRWLSTLDSVDVVLPDAARTPQGSQTLLVPMNRPLFEELSEDIITSSLEVSRTAAIKARVHPRKIDSLLITGGTTRIPAVRTAAERFFGRRGVSGIHPEHAVVIGAAVRAAVISKVPVPGDFVERLRGMGRVGQNVGLALAGGMTEHIITADQQPPTAAHRLYSTSRDGQSQIRLELVQGSSVRTAENRRIGGFVIQGLPQRPAGAISLDVYFELSSTGTLYVTARERSTGMRAQGTFDLNLQ